MSTDDAHFMIEALALARRGEYTTAPNPRVGCVIVRKGVVLATGWHQQAGKAHAEILALQKLQNTEGDAVSDADSSVANESARGATAYITLEPCCYHGRTAPCTDALIAAGIKRVVVAMLDPNPQVAGKGLAQLRAAGIDVVEGVLQAEAEALNAGFISRMERGRPLLRCKLAMSLDGRTAMASGESQWITARAARQDVQRLRAQSSAIMTGIGTVLADDPALTLRRNELSAALADKLTLHDGSLRQPLRIIIDSHARLPVKARILKSPGEVLLVTSVAAAESRVAKSLLSPRLSLLAQPLLDGNQGLDLNALMQALAVYELNDILLEAGATLSGALLKAGLIDELIIYMAPKLMGNAARGLFNLPGLANMAQCMDLEITDIRAVGSDWRITARVNATH